MSSDKVGPMGLYHEVNIYIDAVRYTCYMYIGLLVYWHVHNYNVHIPLWDGK